MDKEKILLIEDEQDISDLVTINLEAAGYRVVDVYDGLEGFLAVEREKPDLIVLDIMLPGMNGLDVCRKLKNHPDLSRIPIIMISAKSEELDVVLGLELGADDYVTKPFSPKVLLSRVKAVLRRKQEPKAEVKIVAFGKFTLDADSYQLRKGSKLIPLTLSEFGILKRLATNPGKVMTRNSLLDDLHGDDAFVVDRNIDVHIASLRKKLGPNFDWIETVRGVGYRFKEDE
jgi:two-component system, OmpR family, alkaline phosphatase synthesis response regulator PhoP